MIPEGCTVVFITHQQERKLLEGGNITILRAAVVKTI